jgi:hypothetical protein
MLGQTTRRSKTGDAGSYNDPVGILLALDPVRRRNKGQRVVPAISAIKAWKYLESSFWQLQRLVSLVRIEGAVIPARRLMVQDLTEK